MSEARERTATWRNWSGSASCRPVATARPTSTTAVQEAVVDAARRGLPIRAAGSGHSFTDAATTDGVLLDLGGLSRLVEVDQAAARVRVEAGMPLHRLNRLLAEHGLAMPNLGDIDRQTIAGAISTGTHGTGARLPGLAAQVVGLTMVGADGGLLRCDATSDADLLNAARVSLGALGVITEVTLQAVPAFVLRAVEAPAALDDVVADLDALVDSHDHFEFYWFPHTDRTLTKRNDRVDVEDMRPLPRWRHLLDDELLSNVVFEGTNRVASWAPRLVPAINAVAARALSARDYADRSDRVFVSPRRVRFHECEYAVPRAAVPEVLAELRRWVDSHDARVPFPVEVRFAAADDIWLSTAHGRESGYVAIHQYHRMPHGEYVAAFEQIAAAVGGRPHWGKLHSRSAAQLAALYPRFADFAATRERLDPERRFANAYTARVLGA